MSNKLGMQLPEIPDWVWSRALPSGMSFVAATPTLHAQRRYAYEWHVIVPDGAGTFTLYCGAWPDEPGLTLEQAVARSDVRGREVIAMVDGQRFEAIGRAVVRHIKGDDERAAHQATAEGVVAHLARTDAELQTLSTCDALRVGRLAIMLVEALGINTKGV